MTVKELIERLIEAVKKEPELEGFDVITEEINHSYDNFNIVEFVERDGS